MVLRLKRIKLEEKTFKSLAKEYIEYLEANKKSKWTIKNIYYKQIEQQVLIHI